MAEKKFYEDSNFWLGVGSYYLISWIFAWYPAVVFGVLACDIACNCWETCASGYLWGLAITAIVYFAIQLAAIAREYAFLVIIYVITFLPFVQIVTHFLPGGGHEAAYGPGGDHAAIFHFDFWPF